LVRIRVGSLVTLFDLPDASVEVLGADLMEAPGVRRSRADPNVGKLPAEEGAEANRREFLGWIAAGSAV